MRLFKTKRKRSRSIPHLVRRLRCLTVIYLKRPEKTKAETSEAGDGGAKNGNLEDKKGKEKQRIPGKRGEARHAASEPTIGYINLGRRAWDHWSNQ